ncbi:MAG TPA: glycosyltransferase [Solirubrobacteraceae bacterium]|nr:glycosyltransferase [Solirubrobacteraceae bacterium]
MTTASEHGRSESGTGDAGQGGDISVEAANGGSDTEAELPVVSVVFLAYNRRDELLYALDQMVGHSGYPAARLEVLVVDNASDDGTAGAVAERFPSVRLVRNERNLGAPGWNAGFALARGDYVLILDDDAYLRPGDLARVVRAAEAEQAGLVSFSVVSSSDEEHPLNVDWRTGLLSYWGCAALLSRHALQAVGGYDPNMFIWANEVDLTMRLLDHGFRHLHIPEIRAVHMKARIVEFEPRRYLVNARHHGYIAAKLMTPVDAAAVVLNIMQQAMVDAVLVNRVALGAVMEVLAGCRAGARRRTPVRPIVSGAYRRNFHPFAGPWPFTRSLRERLRSRRDKAAVEAQRSNRYTSYYSERARYYPTQRASLQL